MSPAGTKTWRFKYRNGGKEKLLVIGRHPHVGLKSARLARDEAKRAIASGRDPALEARRVKLVGQGRSEDTFEKWAKAWFEDQKARWKPVHASDVLESLERDLFPVIGAFPVGIGRVDRVRDVVDAVLDVTDNAAQTRAEIASWSGGPMLYRYGFRVLSYGDPGDGWLALDQNAFGAKGFRLNRQQVIGRVRV